MEVSTWLSSKSAGAVTPGWLPAAWRRLIICCCVKPSVFSRCEDELPAFQLDRRKTNDGELGMSRRRLAVPRVPWKAGVQRDLWHIACSHAGSILPKCPLGAGSVPWGAQASAMLQCKARPLAGRESCRGRLELFWEGFRLG